MKTKLFFLFLFLVLALPIFAQTTKNAQEETPIALVQRQVNGYNDRNIDTFLEPYADDVEIYVFTDKLISRGKVEMKKKYSEMFTKTPNLHCDIVNRMVQGNVVIDQEKVQFGNKILEAIAIYHIENNKIKKVYFIE